MVTRFLVTKIRKVRSRFIELSYPETTKRVNSKLRTNTIRIYRGCNEALKPGWLKKKSKTSVTVVWKIGRFLNQEYYFQHYILHANIPAAITLAISLRQLHSLVCMGPQVPPEVHHGCQQARIEPAMADQAVEGSLQYLKIHKWQQNSLLKDIDYWSRRKHNWFLVCFFFVLNCFCHNSWAFVKTYRLAWLGFCTVFPCLLSQ